MIFFNYDLYQTYRGNYFFSILFSVVLVFVFLSFNITFFFFCKGE